MSSFLLSAAGVAAYLQCSEEYLKKLRIKGEGPLYFKVGRNPMYRKFDVDKWIDSQICGSTFEHKRAKKFPEFRGEMRKQRIG